MYAELLRLIGETIKSKSIKRNKNSFGFEVIQHATA